MKQPKIGIITVLYNSANVLEKFFECLNAQTYKNFILYIIDNASPDDSLALCRRFTNDVWYETKVIETGMNCGIARGNNIGIEQALADGCDLILETNNDIEFAPETIGTLVDSMKAVGADMIVPMVINYYTDQVAYGGGGYKSWTFPVSIEEGPDCEIFHKPRFVDFGSGCFIMIKREVFEKVGFIDERFFLYYEDTDFVWRAVREQGLKLFYEPTVSIRHMPGNSHGGGYTPFIVKMGYRNMAYFMNKYFPWYKRWCIAGYQISYFLLLKLCKPRKYFKMGNPIKHYRDGIALYREWKREGNLKE